MDQIISNAKERTVSLVQANTSQLHDFVLSWIAADIECCDQVVWSKDDEPRLWDTSGLGDWTPIDYKQCGNCGSMVGPNTAFVEVE